MAIYPGWLCAGGVASFLYRISLGVILHRYKLLLLGSCLVWNFWQLIFAKGFAYLPVVLANLKSGFASLFGPLEISILSICTSVFSWQAVCIVLGQWEPRPRFYFARSEKGHLQ